MPLFLIRRDVQGADRGEIDAGAWRAVSCAYNFEGLKWISSYWDTEGGRVFCVYEAENADQIRMHSRLARIPCDEVTPVRELDRARFTMSQSDPAASTA